MTRNTFRHGIVSSFELHVEKQGKGPKVLLAFHGIGQTGRDCFLPFEMLLGNDYTIFAFDLPYHGRSDWQPTGNPEVIEKNQWKYFIEQFLQKNNIASFDVAGFSIGSRFALATAEAFPEKTENLLLMAPDGLYLHPLYRVATHNTITRLCFRLGMKYPELILVPTRLLKSTGVFPASVLRFAGHMLSSEKKRDQIFYGWTAYRKLCFNMKKLYPLFVENQVNIRLFLGQNDFVIPYKKLSKETVLLSDGQIQLFPCGHFNLVNHTAKYLADEFRKHQQ